MENLTEFQRGILYAVALVQHDGATSLAADILRQSGFTDLDCSALDECDKDALREVIQEQGINLVGLNT